MRRPAVLVTIAGIAAAVLSVPLSPLFLTRSAPRTGTLSTVGAWTVLGVTIDQAQIICTGVFVGVTVVVTYRFLTRRDRYGK